MKRSNTGTCFLCDQEVTHRSVEKHIEQCLENNNLAQSSEKEHIFLIKIYSGKEFWIFVDVNSSSKLKELDAYLREIWLECCGHMSQFTINDQGYSCDGGMNKAIHRVLTVDSDFTYEYDFGSTTELKGTVISSRPGPLRDPIHLVARNHLPKDIVCSLCSKKAEVICSYCGTLRCKVCKKNHKGCEGEDGMLPVVNSPRIGVCGYCGPD